jgi:hypothetical protein
MEHNKKSKTKNNPKPNYNTKADKGNTLVILYQDDYNNKIEEFITNNNFKVTT